MGSGYLFVKRMLDLLLAVCLAVPALFVLAVCCVAIKAETRGSAFFVQERPGKNGRIFKIYKLRTMITNTHRRGLKLSDTERMTRTGAVIRRLSLDELPQLYNIFRGEMSFIGPRPLLRQYLPLYTHEQARRHEVLPGISGWAQVNGRNALSWEEKFRLDVWYVDHMSFALDARIFLMTIAGVARRRDINAKNGDTMPAFRGTRKGGV